MSVSFWDVRPGSGEIRVRDPLGSEPEHDRRRVHEAAFGVGPRQRHSSAVRGTIP